MRTNVPHIFAIGDIVGQPMLAHKAVHEAHVAAEVAAGHRRRSTPPPPIPGVAYTHPEVAWVGYTEAQAKAEGKKVETAKFPWAASGRAIANGADYGFTKLIFDAETHRVIGGTIVGPSAGDMIGEVCLAIEMGRRGRHRQDHPPAPDPGETVGMAAEVASRQLHRPAADAQEVRLRPQPQPQPSDTRPASATHNKGAKVRLSFNEKGNGPWKTSSSLLPRAPLLASSRCPRKSRCT